MFTKTDYVNLLNLLKRAKFDGLEEAEVAVTLASKLKFAINPPPPEADEQSSE